MPNNVTASVSLMPEHLAPPGLSGLQHCQPWTFKDLQRRSVKQCEAAAWLSVRLCIHTAWGDCQMRGACVYTQHAAMV